MALEHALMVSLSERAAGGLELARRFDRSIGFFWTATHQQIYRVLARMEADGWVRGEGRATRKTYSVTSSGAAELARWLAEPAGREPLRSPLAVKLRGASYGDRAALTRTVRDTLADHQTRLAHYQHLQQRDYPEPHTLTGAALDRYLVLRGGIGLETFWIDWLTEWMARAGDPAGGVLPPTPPQPHAAPAAPLATESASALAPALPSHHSPTGAAR